MNDLNDLSEKIRKALSPMTIGELKEAIKDMDSSLLIFRFQWGDTEGMCDWKRKETWKQYCRRMKNEQRKEA